MVSGKLSGLTELGNRGFDALQAAQLSKRFGMVGLDPLEDGEAIALSCGGPARRAIWAV